MHEMVTTVLGNPVSLGINADVVDARAGIENYHHA
jgi:hypothetical protein